MSIKDFQIGVKSGGGESYLYPQGEKTPPPSRAQGQTYMWGPKGGPHIGRGSEGRLRPTEVYTFQMDLGGSECSNSVHLSQKNINLPQNLWIYLEVFLIVHLQIDKRHISGHKYFLKLAPMNFQLCFQKMWLPKTSGSVLKIIGN